MRAHRVHEDHGPGLFDKHRPNPAGWVGSFHVAPPPLPPPSQFMFDRPDKASVGNVQTACEALAALCNSIPPFLAAGGLSADSFKATIEAMREGHASDVASGAYVSREPEGGEDELLEILEYLRTGDVLREEESAAVEQGRVPEHLGRLPGRLPGRPPQLPRCVRRRTVESHAWATGLECAHNNTWRRRDGRCFRGVAVLSDGPECTPRSCDSFVVLELINCWMSWMQTLTPNGEACKRFRPIFTRMAFFCFIFFFFLSSKTCTEHGVWLVTAREAIAMSPCENHQQQQQ